MAEKPKKADEPKPKTRKIDAVAAELIAIRDQGKHDRKGCFIKFFHALDERLNITVSIAKTDALLIKATRERFDVSSDADIVLMSLGLLRGYEYQDMPLLDRRRKYLRESNYLQTNSRSKNKNFDNASEKEKNRLIDNLRKTGEDDLIRSLAEFLLEQNIAEYIKDLGGYITKSKTPRAILPKPSYSLSDFSENTDPAKADKKDKEEKAHQDGDINNFFNHSNRSEHYTQILINFIFNGAHFGSKASRAKRSSSDSNNVTEGVKRQKWFFSFTAIFGASVICLVLALQNNRPPTSMGEQIKVPEETITMQSGDAYKINPVFLSEITKDVEPVDFSYTSSNPDILQVLQNGSMYAQNELAEGESVSVEVTIQASDGVTKRIEVTIEKSANGDAPPTVDMSNFEIPYTLETQVRLVGGDKTWGNSVDAKVGDKVEFRVAYKNNDTVNHMNVMIKDILPAGLRLVPGTTKLVNTTYPNGATINQDDITTVGINIGGYTPGSNAFVRFQAEVVDEQLEPCGNTGLVNWAQAGVDKATIQDYATVRVIKD